MRVLYVEVGLLAFYAGLIFLAVVKRLKQKVA
jgi:hypothetical protein